MNKEIKQKWIEALRSGKYKQGTAALRKKDYLQKGKPEFCCLGVLCEIAIKEGVIKDPKKYDRYYNTYLYPEIYGDQLLPLKVVKWAGLEDVNPSVIGPLGKTTSLADLNDKGFNFTEIADLIEQKL